jgi:hypothetical protein
VLVGVEVNSEYPIFYYTMFFHHFIFKTNTKKSALHFVARFSKLVFLDSTQFFEISRANVENSVYLVNLKKKVQNSCFWKLWKFPNLGQNSEFQRFFPEFDGKPATKFLFYLPKSEGHFCNIFANLIFL